MNARMTYRNDRPYGFCPGCSHRLILDALDRVLVKLQWRPEETVMVSDIGCVGLSDQYFVTSAFHGLHGRSLTYATGIKLAHPDLHVIVLIGDGGCGIGGTHVISAARRNIGVATLVFNNLNFGMTGGEHSVTTPTGAVTVTTPHGQWERPLDVAQTVAVNGASYVWRGTAFDSALDAQIETALTHEGFALLDIWELCVAHYASVNKSNPKQLEATMATLGFQKGVIARSDRPEGTQALDKAQPGLRDRRSDLATPLPVTYRAPLDHRLSVVIAGAAGAHIRTAARIVGAAGTMAGLWVTQRDDYPVTVRKGHSVSELILSPHPVHYTGVDCPGALFILSPEGRAKADAYLSRLTPDCYLFVTPECADSDVMNAPVRPVVLEPAWFKGVSRGSLTLAQVAAGLGVLGCLPPEAWGDAAEQISPRYAEPNSRAIEAGLRASEDV
jgi:2-oxoglutarate/2-oxoacid ferredoxin oxidoreductase subunit beta